MWIPLQPIRSIRCPINKKQFDNEKMRKSSPMPIWTTDSQTYRVLIFGCVCEPEVNQDPQHTGLQQHGSVKESNNLYHMLHSFVHSLVLNCFTSF